MWRFLIFGVVIITAASAVKLEKCRNKPLPLDVRSTTCDDTTCYISISNPIGFELDARIPNDTLHVFPSVLFLYRLPEGNRAEIPMEIDLSRGCDYLVSHTCPLSKDDIATWTFDWDFLPAEVFGEGVKFRAEINLYDKNVDPVTCFRVNLVMIE
ncbi:uncharacterized protein LOC132257915 [Phlebotomus argentipes]|uniref:uncharacterized protein LOC132257915 n=1 Tax=Phlebotomus argentipes TaxID=94469 RepID=UPI0028937516|nr:uncharacterized protein LOC132257915 [Phlebotomus argentipes]